jgi:hypothetical protein
LGTLGDPADQLTGRIEQHRRRCGSLRGAFVMFGSRFRNNGGLRGLT